MRFAAVILSGLVFGTLQVSSAFLEKRSGLDVLLPRQDSGETCVASCAPFQAFVDDCTTVSCFCTVTVAASLQVCINCAIGGNPNNATLVKEAQSLINSFDQSCKSTNLPGVVTIPVSTASSTKPVSTTPKVSSSSSIIAPPPSTISQVTVTTRSTSTSSTDSPTPTPTAPTSGGALSTSISSKVVVVALLLSIGVAFGMDLV